LSYIENHADHGKSAKFVRGELDRRDPLCKQWVQRDVARMYALRPRDADVWYLSPYEFWMYWEISPALYAATTDMMVDEEGNPEKYHCALTTAGILKVIARSQEAADSEAEPAKLIPGEDYAIKEAGGSSWWVASTEAEATACFRHTWVLKRRMRPRDPSFHGCALPYQSDKQPDRTGKIVMTYFRPWCFMEEDSDDQVIDVARMCSEGWNWPAELNTWLQGQVLTAQAERWP
jgi:hypothetical protein